MIEFVLAERCTGCGDCVEACPSHVFDLVPGGTAVIARVEDCQTCFMCELYCRTDALYVGPEQDRQAHPHPAEIVAAGLMGQYRRDSAWHEWTDDPRYRSEFWRMGQIMGRGRDHTVARNAAARDRGT